jgi:hypothetical protein
MGFRQPYRSDLFLHRQDVDFLEIIADHYMDTDIEKQKELDLIAAHFTLIPHGLNLSLGSAEGLDANYARKFAHLIQRINPPWWSEHIAFTRAGGVEIGHLSPVPFTYEAIEVITRNIAEMRHYLEMDVPLILENITYMVEMPGAEMNEAQFLTELLERADCGLLLDVTNLYTNAVNYGYNLQTIVEQLPLERVVQLHFAGGYWHQGMLIDSHSHPTAPEVWDLMDEIVARAPVKGIILERDEELPPFAELREEMRRAREIGRRWRRWA